MDSCLNGQRLVRNWKAKPFSHRSAPFIRL
jgi:hypothetical protein